ncbi:hypothetical protein WUBG_09227, partial [Wuchereria bancrofti]
MWITWLTYNDTFSSVVEYGINDLRWSVKGSSSLFIDGGKQRSRRYIHRVLLTGLIPGTIYQYHVGSEYGWSSIYRFKAMQNLTNHEYIYAVYGDLGVVNARSLGKIQQQAQRSVIDAVLHIGDMAYNLDTVCFIFLQQCFRLFHCESKSAKHIFQKICNGVKLLYLENDVCQDEGQFGDQFGRQIEPVAAYVPYMMVVVLILVLLILLPYQPNFYYFTEYGSIQIANQWKWLTEDLKRASANRDKYPWIITMGHRPMYCSNYDSDDCTKYESRV